MATCRIAFPTHSAQFDEKVLPEVAAYLSAHPDLRLQLIGSVASGEAAELAQQRAEAVKQSLIKSGVAEKRLQIAAESQQSGASVSFKAW